MSFNQVPQNSLSWPMRSLIAAISLGLLGGFLLSVFLIPDSRGYGTHQQLGLPPCSFQMMFGIPCPSCGGTTSFACFVRGQWWSAMRANLAAFALALVCVVLLPWTAISAWRGKLVALPVPANLHSACWMMFALCVLALVQWGIRLASS